MLYFDFGDDIVIQTYSGIRKFKRYSSFSNSKNVPTLVLFKAHTIIAETMDGKRIWWHKNRDKHTATPLTEEELKQFMFQKLATEHVQ